MIYSFFRTAFFCLSSDLGVFDLTIADGGSSALGMKWNMLCLLKFMERMPANYAMSFEKGGIELMVMRLELKSRAMPP